MNILEKRKFLKNKIFSLQDEVSRILIIDDDVDNFLDNSTILDEWEEIIPDAEYGIFVMAILNNVKRATIIDKILDSILNTGESNFKALNTENNDIKHHPFC
tara:strand:- start:197 stop:502 length:306 start_codon:yes stop_codon:yes gene_type:complete